MFRSPKVNDHERTRLRAYIPLFVAAMIFWMIFEQAASTLASYAKDNTDLSLFGVTVSPEFFQSINPAAIILLAPVFAWLWIKLDDRPPTAVKFALGLTFAALSFVFLAGASWLADGGKTSAWVLVVVYVIQTIGELCLSPVGLAATTLLAPRRPSAGRRWRCGSWRRRPATRSPRRSSSPRRTRPRRRTSAPSGSSRSRSPGGMFALAPWVTRHIRAGADAESRRRCSTDRDAVGAGGRVDGMADTTLLRHSDVTAAVDARHWRVLLQTLRATFSAPDFSTAAAFVARIAAAADAANHHPDVVLRWGQVTVTTTSHDAGGLTQRDVDLAATVSALADELGLTGDVPRSETLEIAVDALDIPAVKPFWAAVMGYEVSPRRRG